MTNISDVRRIAVIGSGIMGTGIASIALLGGYQKVILSDIDNSALKKSRDSIDSVVKALEHEDRFKEYISSHPFLNSLSSVNFAELKANRKAVGVIAEGCTAGEIMDRLVCEVDLQRAVSDVDFVIEAVPDIYHASLENREAIQTATKRDRHASPWFYASL
jgi:3-hydroxyacyl-CoA dehydrogenase